MHKYDYIFSGVGLAAMMVLYEMMQNGLLENTSILLLDPESKTTNDRTWCFWESDEGTWDSVVAKKWSRGFFKNRIFKKDCFNSRLQYKMIESKSFYDKIIGELRSCPGIVWKKETVYNYEEKDHGVIVRTNQSTYNGSILFNSILDFESIQQVKKYPLLLQHFKGWFVKTKQPSFTSDVATFMDFSVPQLGNTRFMYVLPVSDTEALVEYTLFSANLLEAIEYEQAIATYLKQKGILEYEIVRKEQGVIPMTAYPFWEQNSKHILNIGSAGGWTKASTGYTFKNCMRQSKNVVAFLQENPIDFSHFYKPNRFTFYDSLFVDVLYRENYLGYKLFGGMFSKVKSQLVFDFLDEKTSWEEELKVIWSCPKLPFLKALLLRLLRF